MTVKYHANIMYGHATLACFEVELRDQQRFVRVRWDDRELGIVSFPEWNYPDYLLCDGRALIWGGYDVWVLDPAAAAPRHVSHDDEVLAVYEHDAQFIVLGDSSVTIVDATTFAAVSTRGLDGPLLSSWWTDGELRVQNLDRVVFGIECDAQNSIAVHVIHAAK
jgi:hypothetical protein